MLEAPSRDRELARACAGSSLLRPDSKCRSSGVPAYRPLRRRRCQSFFTSSPNGCWRAPALEVVAYTAAFFQRSAHSVIRH